MTVSDWKSRVASIGCIACRNLENTRDVPAELHHPRTGQGKSQRASDWLVVPLCPRHHEGKDGIHSGTFYQKYKSDEMDLLAWTIEAVAKSRA